MVDRQGPTDCWMWTGSTLPSGYGRVGGGPTPTEYAHRVAWELTYGPIPDGLFVCHSCDTTGCVSPRHLFLGSHRANMADMVAKKRNSTKLDADAVRAIRRRAITESVSAIAKDYPVGEMQVRRIIARKYWRHIT